MEIVINIGLIRNGLETRFSNVTLSDNITNSAYNRIWRERQEHVKGQYVESGRAKTFGVRRHGGGHEYC
jgi:hypothetical protein